DQSGSPQPGASGCPPRRRPRLHFRSSLPALRSDGRIQVNPRNRFFVLLGIIILIALGYYFFSPPSHKDLALIRTVDSNQAIVSPQTAGRLHKLLVDEGTPVKAGDLIAIIDPAELQAQAAAAAATINSLRSKVAEMRYTEQSTKGSTSSDVA